MTGVAAVFALALPLASAVSAPPARPSQPAIGARVAPTLQVDGLVFKDLDKDGTLDPFEDWRRPVGERVDDLVTQMTVEEKAGLMVGPSLAMGPGGTVREEPVFGVNPFAGGPPALVSPGTTDALHRRHIVQFINRENAAPRTMARWLNAVQEVAEARRLGTPVLFVTNPRNHYGAAATFGIAEASGAFSQWPGTLGLAATRDAALVEEFARTAAQEYVAVGIRGAYHPTADVATEPRWGRFRETFGEDADLAARLIAAVVRGFQGKELGPRSVAVTTKHFPGAGPASGGQDAHFPWGRNQVYPGGNLEYHLRPWRAAIEAGTAMIMPYYAVPKGITSEELGMAYNREIVTDLLRGRLGYAGVVNSDTGVTVGMPWGVESLSVAERYRKAIEAGVDRLGGDATPEIIVELVKGGSLPESRVDESARRILRVLFALGLFENPYVSPEEAARTVRRDEFQRRADLAQRKSIVLLKNAGGILPLRRGARMYVEGVDAAVAARYGFVSTAGPDGADVCVLRVSAPRGALGPRLRERGSAPIDLTLPAEARDRVLAVARTRPTVVALHLENPLVVPELARESAALLATFGVSDEALFDVLTGEFAPEGRLPFEMPSSMAAVRAQLEDVPHDSRDPLFPIGHGLGYPAAGTPPSPVVSSGFVFDRAPFRSAHASTIVETGDGLVAAWFGGTEEGHPDVGIWVSRHGPTGWSSPVEVADGVQPDGGPHPCWNPVLFQPSRGPLVLFYKVGPSPREWWGLARTSDDGGRSWSGPIRLPDGILGPIRAKPVELPGGDVLAGSSTEHDGWVVHVERWTPPDLASPSAWRRSGPLNDPARFEAIQPTVLVHSPSRLQALCRSRQKVVTELWSDDGGQSWGPMRETPLPNPSSGIDAVRLLDGRFLLVHNPDAAGRGRLHLSVSGDGAAWRTAAVLEDGAAGEYSYPAAIQARDGAVHVTYTWRRERIRHVVVDPARIP